MPRFVILTHDWPHPHWDLMLECGGVLRTWRLLQAPEIGKDVAAEPLGDHRKLYLDYEGPVSGNRGTVRRWDAGTYESISESPDRLCVKLQGRRKSGTIVLQKTRDSRWLLSSPADAAS
jgi:DNA polymerase ligase (LigD)-like protein